jgi:serine protease Do
MSVLEELQQATAGVAASAGPATVGLRFGWRPASGVVIAQDRVLTCAHAVRRDEAGAVFADGRRDSGRPAAVDAAGDLAVIAVETGAAPVIEWRDAPAGLGMPVFALARLSDGGLRVTSGAVSALGRSFRGPRGRRIAGSVEHTAAVARGSAGGPLVDATGRLVGLSSVRLDGGLVLALTADADLRARAEELARGEAPVRRTLGVGVVSSRAARRMRRAVGLPERDGLLVREVQVGGAAAAAGVEPGDLIVAAGGIAVATIDDLHGILDGAGEAAIALALVRGESEREVHVTVAEG